MMTKTQTSWSDLFKKVVTAGKDTADLATGALSIMNPKDASKSVVEMMLSMVLKRKDELLEVLAKELSQFLSHLNVGEELSKVLKGFVVNLNATIDFEPKKEKAKPVAKRTVKSKKKK